MGSTNDGNHQLPPPRNNSFLCDVSAVRCSLKTVLDHDPAMSWLIWVTAGLTEVPLMRSIILLHVPRTPCIHEHHNNLHGHARLPMRGVDNYI